ncbi:MAG TPA: hypothetical protein VGR20_08740, partial [Acidimicrobiia bacterium]|nr:hypothetical protein [Acidimicrobiia bacterium]
IRVLDGGEFTVCKVLRSLVQAGLVEIDADPASPAAGASDVAVAPEAAPPAKAGRTQSRPNPESETNRDPADLDGAELDATEPDPIADGLDRGAVVALLASARSK